MVEGPTLSRLEDCLGTTEASRERGGVWGAKELARVNAGRSAAGAMLHPKRETKIVFSDSSSDIADSGEGEEGSV